ncbi:Hsp33 family molecular chaperone HslO [Agarilytica rhodophyticola]|uniref:Hsp33 family molecular chaperone HslO n=1 Tax=Agarilytica rhodophyticola TaxID=1737490 RepID=UPI000B343824|nr:Hsp33 family molecular chaperone HslO [Agarilytica rhodophyticola]
MSTNDYINRFLFDDTDIRGEIVAIEDTFQAAYQHQTFPKALTPIFGDFLAGAALLAEVLKFEGTLTLQARGQGNVALIMAETNHEGHLRGILRLQPDADSSAMSFDDISLPQLLGNGVLTITIEPNKGKRYQGIIAITNNTLAECLQDYFSNSEQLPTQIQLYSDAGRCGGLFLQCLPKQLVTDEEKREDLWQTAKQLAMTLSAKELFELENEQVLLRLFHEMQCRVFDAKPIVFRCSCSKERSGNALKSIGYDDAQALLQERDIISIDCEFCGKVYHFGEKDLDEIFERKNNLLH